MSDFTKLEAFSLSHKLLHELDSMQKRKTGGFGARAIGVIATPLTNIIDALIQTIFAVGKLVTGCVATPYNLIAKNINRKYAFPKDLELSSSLIHLMQGVKNIFRTAVVPLLTLFNPTRAYSLYDKTVEKTKLESYTLTKKLQQQCDDWHRNAKPRALGVIGSRALGTIASPVTSALDAVSHFFISVGKIVTGLFVSPYNFIATRVNPKYALPKDFEISSAIQHAIQAVEHIFDAGLLTPLTLIDPSRSSAFFTDRHITALSVKSTDQKSQELDSQNDFQENKVDHDTTLKREESKQDRQRPVNFLDQIKTGVSLRGVKNHTFPKPKRSHGSGLASILKRAFSQTNIYKTDEDKKGDRDDEFDIHEEEQKPVEVDVQKTREKNRMPTLSSSERQRLEEDSKRRLQELKQRKKGDTYKPSGLQTLLRRHSRRIVSQTKNINNSRKGFVKNENKFIDDFKKLNKKFEKSFIKKTDKTKFLTKFNVSLTEFKANIAKTLSSQNEEELNSLKIIMQKWVREKQHERLIRKRSLGNFKKVKPKAGAYNDLKIAFELQMKQFRSHIENLSAFQKARLTSFLGCSLKDFKKKLALHESHVNSGKLIKTDIEAIRQDMQKMQRLLK